MSALAKLALRDALKSKDLPPPPSKLKIPAEMEGDIEKELTCPGCGHTGPESEFLPPEEGSDNAES